MRLESTLINVHSSDARGPFSAWPSGHHHVHLNSNIIALNRFEIIVDLESIYSVHCYALDFDMHPCVVSWTGVLQSYVSYYAKAPHGFHDTPAICASG